MAHSVSEAAARAVKNSERKVVETRTPEQRLADIRKNRQAKLFVTPDDQDFLLAQYDQAMVGINTANTDYTRQRLEIERLDAEVATLKAQISDMMDEAIRLEEGHAKKTEGE